MHSTTQENFNDYLEYRLQEWANWFCRGLDYGIGYPSKTTDAKLRDNGGIVLRSKGTPYLPCHESAEQIEMIVKKLAMQNKLTADILRLHYTERGSLRHKAEKLKVSHTYFKYCLEMAKQWVAGWLTATHR